MHFYKPLPFSHQTHITHHHPHIHPLLQPQTPTHTQDIEEPHNPKAPPTHTSIALNSHNLLFVTKLIQKIKLNIKKITQ